MMLKSIKEALDWLIQEEMVVEFTQANNLSPQEIIDAEDKLTKAVQAKNSHYHVQKWASMVKPALLAMQWGW